MTGVIKPRLLGRLSSSAKEEVVEGLAGTHFRPPAPLPLDCHVRDGEQVEHLVADGVGDVRRSAEFAGTVVRLPLWPGLRDQQVARVIEAVTAFAV